MPAWAAPPRPRGRVASAQSWLDVTFLHWPVAPEAVAGLLPPGVRPDVVDGRTYVGLIAFRMSRAGLGGLPVPYLGDFLETNVRLYTVDDCDRHGVWFCSLESQRLLVALASRAAVGIPYTWARMQAEASGPHRRYRSTRRWPHRGLRTDLEIEIGPPVEPTELEVWLTARWGAHSRIAGRTLWTPNTHPSWPLHSADLVHLDDELVRAAGVRVDADSMLRPLWSPGVRTTFGPPKAL